MAEPERMQTEALLALVTAAAKLGAGSVQILSVDRLSELNPLLPVLVPGLDRRTLPLAIEALQRLYPAEHAIDLLPVEPDGRAARRTLAELAATGGEYATALWVEPARPEDAPASHHSLRAIVHRLRAPGGCPWDRKQTAASLARYVVEEAHEVVDAIEDGRPAELRDELGDLLLQVYLQAELAAEVGDFDVVDVTRTISQKLIRRHPHVFSDWTVSGAGEVELNWEQLKRQEKGSESDSALSGVPRSLPAVARAQEVQRRLIRAGFDWPTRAGVLAKLDEELAELRAALQDPAALEHELGDAIFMLTRLATDGGFEAEQALHSAVRRVIGRFEHLERAAHASGRSLAERSDAELLELWREAKALEGRGPPSGTS